MAFVYYVASSLDGFIADAQGSLDWLLDIDPVGGPDTAAFMESVGVQVMGSATYSWLLEHERLLDAPQRWQEFFGAMPTVVLSTRDLPIPGGADIVVACGDIRSLLDRLRALAGDRDIWIVGGGELAGQFLDAGALDRIEVTYAPVLLGAGAPLLPRHVDASRLHVREASHRGAFVHVVYDVVESI